MSGVWVSRGCCNQGPQSRWLTTEISSPSVLEATTLKSGCQQGHALLNAKGEGPSCLFQLPLIITVASQSLSVVAWLALFLCFYVVFSSKDTNHIILRAYPTPLWPRLMISAMTLFPSKVTFQGTGGQAYQHIFLGDTSQCTTEARG